MPIDPSIPLQAQVGSPFTSMGQMLQPMTSLASLANIQQQNQMMQAETQNLQQSAQLNTQLQGERNTFSAAMQDPNAPFKNSDGTIDYGKLQQWTATKTPLVGSQYADQIMGLAQHVNAYKTTLSNMSDSDMQRVNAVAHSFMGPNGQPITDPGNMINQLSSLKRTLSGPGSGYVDQVIQGIQTNAQSPQGLQTALGQFARDTTPATAQTQQLQGATQMLNNGAQTVPVASNGEYGQAPGTLTGTPGIPNQIGPGERQQVGTNALTGGMTVTNRDANGNITGVTNAPTQGIYVPQPGDAQALPVLQGERDAARQQFAGAGLQHENNRIVLDNIDNVDATGPSGQAFRNIASAFGFNAGDAKDSATAYDMVGKGLERSALQAAQTMGPSTNAGLEAQIKANGSLAYTPQAIKQITRLNDAITSGTQAYQPGLERAIAANPSAGVFAKRQFDQQWGASFDPRIFEMYNAAKGGDTATVSSIVNSLGGKNSAQFKALMNKAANLNQLSNGGGVQ
ncbi:hypothetical protein M3I54_22530 [Paraburkholderia sp. CNPSo 3274]|uniref:hypothetical protein n=1 Tax=Paraburkholderia sp. CNPSo 3274 TaxID=2940932 RepID=UPI0020B67041|nr:hypothetical protein [Paraburkholderia sp. CNPSo 3274]MCP3709723.1 hypothetical protein [Paraburkholderia sp. CNPSo 3274]